jgi:hypothetical protein
MTAHSRAELPVFGVTPSPVTIFTLGMLLLTRDLPLLLLVIPVMWSLIGGSARDPAAGPTGLVAARQRPHRDRARARRRPQVVPTNLGDQTEGNAPSSGLIIKLRNWVRDSESCACSAM